MAGCRAWGWGQTSGGQDQIPRQLGSRVPVVSRMVFTWVEWGRFLEDPEANVSPLVGRGGVLGQLIGMSRYPYQAAWHGGPRSCANWLVSSQHF